MGQPTIEKIVKKFFTRLVDYFQPLLIGDNQNTALLYKILPPISNNPGKQLNLTFAVILYNNSSSRLDWDMDKIELKLLQSPEDKIPSEIRVPYHIEDDSSNFIVTIWAPGCTNTADIFIQKCFTAGIKPSLLIKGRKPSLMKSLQQLVASNTENSIQLPNENAKLFSNCDIGNFIIRIPVKHELLIENLTKIIKNGEIVISIPKKYYSN